MKKIVITGPESTGKTELTKYLAQQMHLPWVDEFARSYIANLNRPYLATDLVEIAKGQLNTEREIKSLSPSFLLCDTDLLTLKIWSEFKYSACHEFIVASLKKNLPDVYLLCYPDIDWVYDLQRENPHDRLLLFGIYKTEIENLGVKYIVIKGDNRRETAISFLKDFK